MNFRKSPLLDKDEITLDFVPLIDVLLVVVIFITATTSFNQFYEIPVQLPQASNQSIQSNHHVLAISSEGQYALDGRFISEADQSLIEALQRLPEKEALLIYADANARHASVVFALEAAGQAQFEKISFATQH